MHFYSDKTVTITDSNLSFRSKAYKLTLGRKFENIL